MSGIRFEAKDGGTLEASTDHAWPVPRGEVYITIQTPGVNHDEHDFALTPEQARSLALRLNHLADVAETNPEATINESGEPI